MRIRFLLMQAPTLLSQAPHSKHQLAASLLLGQAHITPLKTTCEHLQNVAILEGKVQVKHVKHFGFWGGGDVH